MTPYQPSDSGLLAERASLERDSKRLAVLVAELNRLLRERQEALSCEQQLI